jgi:hypothetical protein
LDAKTISEQKVDPKSIECSADKFSQLWAILVRSNPSVRSIVSIQYTFRQFWAGSPRGRWPYAGHFPDTRQIAFYDVVSAHAEANRGKSPSSDCGVMQLVAMESIVRLFEEHKS